MGRGNREDRYSRGLTPTTATDAPDDATETAAEPAKPKARKRKPKAWNSRSTQKDLRAAVKSRGLEVDDDDTNDTLREKLAEWDEANLED